MRRATWFRFLSAVLAFWIPLTVGEPSALRLCAAHHGGAAPVAGTGSHHGHSASASTASEGSGDHTPAPGESHHCTCIAGCSTSAVSLAVFGGPVAAVVVATLETSGYSPTAPSRARPSPDYARPHTTGPPRA